MSVVTAVSLRRGHHFSKPNVAEHSPARRPRRRWRRACGRDGEASLARAARSDPAEPAPGASGPLRNCSTSCATRALVVAAGDIGENVTTRGIDLLALPTGTRLHLGDTAMVEVTGLRNPCVQLDTFQKGLMAATLDKDADGNLIRKAGIMSVVLAGGEVRPAIRSPWSLPAGAHRPLQPV